MRGVLLAEPTMPSRSSGNPGGGGSEERCAWSALSGEGCLLLRGEGCLFEKLVVLPGEGQRLGDGSLG